MSAEEQGQQAKISFQSREEYACPVCGAEFHREELLSGSGRLIAGELTDELHRLYEPSAKFGEVFPLIYQATVCPKCWFAAEVKDFSALPEAAIEAVEADREKRRADTELAFPGVDFNESRDLLSGAASQYLVLRCAAFYPTEFSPTIKQGIAALRGGWLIEELERKKPDEGYGWLVKLFKKKAAFLYNNAMRLEESKEETLSGVTFFGPDTDKNYGYEGALYLSALLEYKYAYLGNPELRAPALDGARRTIARIFGLGKASKAKPGPLLEHARRLYENITSEIKESDD